MKGQVFRSSSLRSSGNHALADVIPSPIQSKAISPVPPGRNIMDLGRTGTTEAESVVVWLGNYDKTTAD